MYFVTAIVVVFNIFASFLINYRFQLLLDQKLSLFLALNGDSEKFCYISLSPSRLISIAGPNNVFANQFLLFSANIGFLNEDNMKSHFNEMVFPELNREEAQTLLEQYNKVDRLY